MVDGQNQRIISVNELKYNITVLNLNKIFSSKKRFALLALFVFSAISLVWLFSVSKKPSISPTPTPTPIKFELIRTIPANGSKNLFPATSAVEFDFSKQIDVSTLVIVSNPNADVVFETDQSGKTLFIRAPGGWRLATTYEITVDVLSKDKDKLPEKIVYTFEANIPKSSQMDEIPR
jgi:hypothetical protein